MPHYEGKGRSILPAPDHDDDLTLLEGLRAFGPSLIAFARDFVELPAALVSGSLHKVKDLLTPNKN